MRRLDELYLELPYFGSRKFAVLLGRERRQPHQPKTRATTDAVYGHRSLVPEAESESSGSRSRDLSVPAPRCHRQPAQPGLEHRYYLHSDALGLSVPGGHYGLVQPLRAELGSLQYHGGGLLPVCAGGGVPLRQVRDLQLRSRLRNLPPASFCSRSRSAPSGSAWMDAGEPWTTCLSSGCGAR